MMGNQRQVLRDNIEKELVSKLEAAKEVLSQLNKNLEINKQNSLNAKEEIRVTADLIKDILIKRKKELIKEVENLHHAQEKPLKDAVKSTYITMGKLQNMLSNLDSFDQSQLVTLQIPAVDTSLVNEPAQIGVVLNSENIKEELKEWGSVTTDDDFQCCMLEDVPDHIRLACDNSNLEDSSTASGSPAMENKENKSNAPAKPQVCSWSDWAVENWLSRSSKKATISNESKDDLDGSMDQDMDQFVVLQENDAASNQMDQDSSGSVAKIETENPDLSLWLKPKKNKSLVRNADESKNIAQIAIVQAESILKSLTIKDAERRKSTLSGKRHLDFPCLHMGSENWIRKRKPRSVSSACSNKSVANKLQLIPPTYNLPAPFWLSNKCKRRI